MAWPLSGGGVAAVGDDGGDVRAPAFEVVPENGIIAPPAGSEPGPSGPVPIGGLWQEFAFSGVGVPATGCAPADPGGPGCSPSSGGNAKFADAPPWTFTAPAGGVVLTVTDAFLAGDVLRVFDFGYAVGDTSPSVPGGSCGDDPVPCLADPLMSSGTFSLAAGSHSITITAIASPFGAGAAYFRLDEAPTPTPTPTPTRPPTPTPTREVVGGLSVDPTAIPPSGGGAGWLLTALIATGAAALVGLSGALWYARRRDMR